MGTSGRKHDPDQFKWRMAQFFPVGVATAHSTAQWGWKGPRRALLLQSPAQGRAAPIRTIPDRPWSDLSNAAPGREASCAATRGSGGQWWPVTCCSEDC